MKYQIWSGLSLEQLERQVPPTLRAQLDAARRMPAPYTLILFTGGREAIAISQLVREALDKVRGAESLIAAAGGFTAEAREALVARGAIPLVAGAFYWTDASYKERLSY